MFSSYEILSYRGKGFEKMLNLMDRGGEILKDENIDNSRLPLAYTLYIAILCYTYTALGDSITAEE